MIYVVIYFLMVASIVLAGHSRPLTMACYSLWLAILLLFVAFRFEVGCDWSGYAFHYDAQKFNATLATREPGYWLLLSILSEYEMPFESVNIIAAAVFFFGLHRFAARQPDPLAILTLAFPVLIIGMPMSALRQSVAIGCLCMAFVAWQDRSIIKYVAYVVIGATFHQSAIFFLVCAPLVKSSLTGGKLFLMTVLAIPLLAVLASEVLDFYADRYVGTELDAAGGIFRGALVAVTGILVRCFSSAWKRLDSPDWPMMDVLSWVMIAVLPVVFLSTVIGDRFAYYLMPLHLAVLARLPALTVGGTRNIARIGPYVVFGTLLLIWTQYSSHFHKCYLPYKYWLP